MTDTTTPRVPITRILLTYLMSLPGEVRDSVAAANGLADDKGRSLDLDPAKCSSALSKGYESTANGWEYVHRTEKRPYGYWFDPNSRRVPASEETTLDPIETAPLFEQMSVITEQQLGDTGADARVLLKRGDGSLWLARPFDLSAAD